MNTRRILFSIIGLIVISGFLSCKVSTPEVSTVSIFDYLQDSVTTSISLTTDLSQLHTKSDLVDYQKGTISFETSNGTEQALDVKIRQRGQTRKRMCSFPPLKLKFDDTDLQQLGLGDYRTLKLVVPCHEDSIYQQILFKEYLAYKMYNTLTEKSFRVQLVHLSFSDSKGVTPGFSQYGFLIEHQKQVASRVGAKLVHKSEKAIKSIDRDQYQLFTLFQYMIGNTDWNLTQRHNSRMLYIDESMGSTPVPYDFDFSGLVDAPYAKPYHTLPIDDVKERFFQFRSKKEVDFCPIIDLFVQKKPEILGLCSEVEHLEKKCREEMHQYLVSFFELIEAPKAEHTLVNAGN